MEAKSRAEAGMEPAVETTMEAAKAAMHAATREARGCGRGREREANEGRCQNRDEGSHGSTPLKGVAPSRSSHR